MENETPILIDHVTRSYDGTPVVRDLNLAVKPGGIYGFLGRNGSGKTTTLRMLAGLIRPHAGEVRVLGSNPFTMGAKERQWLGYMSEKATIPSLTKVRGVIRLGRELYPTWDGTLAEALLAKFGIPLHKAYGTLSAGNQRLLGFIAAIAPRPRVLLLDEPAANLDVVARREILDDILTLIRDCGCTVLFSTHILSDVERVADEVGILAHGGLRVSEPLDRLKDTIRQVRFYGFANGSLPGDIPESFRTVRGHGEMTMTLRTSPLTTPETLAQRWNCRQETRALNLEDIFVELSRN